MPLCTPDSVCYVCRKKSAEFTVAMRGKGTVSVDVCNGCLRQAVYWAMMFSGGFDAKVGPYYGMDVCASFDAETGE